MNVLATFRNDPEKIYGRVSANGNFPCEKLKMRKKSPKISAGDYEKNYEIILINMFSPTFVPNLISLAGKMSSGMPKKTGSLNGPLCAY